MTIDLMLQQINEKFFGDSDTLKKIMCVLLSKEHLLIEDRPGTGKTTLAKAICEALSLDSKRITMTIDTFPSDIVGFSTIEQESRKAKFYPGPIFTNILLIDEINRASGRTQAALLEAMEERQVTIEGKSIELDDPFMVIATQNPLDYNGTNPLLESQLDRFSMCLTLGYPTYENEIKIVKKHDAKINAIMDKEQFLTAQKVCENVFVKDEIYKYIVDLIRATRNHPEILQGASPRVSVSLIKMAKACAYINGRDYVIPDDIQFIFADTLAHRIILNNVNDNLKEKSREILNEILTSVQIHTDI